MRTSTLLAAAVAFTSTTFAAPVTHAGPPPSLSHWFETMRHASGDWSAAASPQCMPTEDALIVADTFKSLIRGYTLEQAEAALTPTFIDYSSAVSIIINRGAAEPEDVTAPIFTSRDEFMQGHGKQQPIPFETLKVWHTCEGVVTMVWRTARSGQGQVTESAAIPVTGVAVLETEPAEVGNPLGYKYRIHTLWSEFNTAAWLVNNGVFTPEGPVTPVPLEVANGTSTVKRSLPATKFDVGLA